MIEGFKDLLLLAASTAMELRKPNPEAVRVAEVLVSGDLDKLNGADLEQIFHDAGLFCERIIVK